MLHLGVFCCWLLAACWFAFGCCLLCCLCLCSAFQGLSFSCSRRDAGAADRCPVPVCQKRFDGPCKLHPIKELVGMTDQHMGLRFILRGCLLGNRRCIALTILALLSIASAASFPAAAITTCTSSVVYSVVIAMFSLRKLDWPCPCQNLNLGLIMTALNNKQHTPSPRSAPMYWTILYKYPSMAI